MSDFSGGGSGFIKYHTSTVPAGEMVITAKVGASRRKYPGNDPSDPSIVTLPSTTITALGGHRGGIVRNNVRLSDAGGDGYSGGGGFSNKRGYNGGSNGGNGEGGSGTPCSVSCNGKRTISNSGGRGTGENVASYVFDHFHLSPGQGGRYHKRTHTLWNPAYFGGGGGGVMVNGKGPTSHYVDKPIWYAPPSKHLPTYPGQGKGYGGGGGTCDGPCGTIDGKRWGSGHGQSGVILLEVV